MGHRQLYIIAASLCIMCGVVCVKQKLFVSPLGLSIHCALAITTAGHTILSLQVCSSNTVDAANNFQAMICVSAFSFKLPFSMHRSLHYVLSRARYETAAAILRQYLAKRHNYISSCTYLGSQCTLRKLPRLTPTSCIRLIAMLYHSRADHLLLLETFLPLGKSVFRPLLLVQ